MTEIWFIDGFENSLTLSGFTYFERDIHASHDFVAFNQAIFGSNHKIICGVV